MKMGLNEQNSYVCGYSCSIVIIKCLSQYMQKPTTSFTSLTKFHCVYKKCKINSDAPCQCLNILCFSTVLLKLIVLPAFRQAEWPCTSATILSGCNQQKYSPVIFILCSNNMQSSVTQEVLKIIGFTFTLFQSANKSFKRVYKRLSIYS